MPIDDKLVIEGLRVAYGSRIAVQGVSFEVSSTECVALIGANGAGKTSTINAIVGIKRPEAGVVTFRGEEITRRSSREIARRGITLCPEGRHLFPDMSVYENLLLGANATGASRREIGSLVEEMVDRFPVLGTRRKQLAGTLSGGEQQMVAIGRALMAKPKLLILDEPSLGLAPKLVEQVLEIASAIVASGCGVLISEQNVEATLEICDRAYVMEAGRLTHSGTAAELQDDSKVLAAFLGFDEAEVS